MKSSFSWPGRPPAEMISRNANRLLTSILGGSPKRGAFDTSILDGTPKRGAFDTSILDGTPKGGAFCTSILDGSPKRGLFCTSILDGRLKRDAFLCTRVGAYCIRPTKRSRMGTRVAKGSQTRDSLSPTGPFDGAYAIRPYHATSKRDAFLCTRVGAYCIRPTKRSRKGTRSVKGNQTHDSLSPTGPFGGAYLGTPYHATSKRDAFYTSYLVATLKRGAFCTSYLVGTPKRGVFCTSYLVATLKRDAFCTSYLVATPKRGAFLCTWVGAYCIRPTKRSRKGTGSAKGDQTCDFLSPTGPFGGAYAIRPYHATSKRDAFYTSYLVATLKRGAFCTSYLVGTLKRGAFCTSYLVATLKRAAFYTSYLVATLKRGAFYTSYLVATLKRAAFCTSYLVATLKRGAFCTSYLIGSLKRGVFCLFYSSFLALMQEKKQKKIKASGMPAQFAGYILEAAEASGQVCRVHY